MDREKVLQIRAKCKKFFIYMKFMATIVLTFFYLQNQFFETGIQSNILAYKINAVAGTLQIFILSFFIYFEEGSIAQLKTNIVKNVFCDSTTLIMALPTICLILSDQLLLMTTNILPISNESANNYSVIAVALFTTFLLKKRMFLTQIVAIGFLVKGASLFPSDRSIFDSSEAFILLADLSYGDFVIAAAILFTGLSWVILEKVLKSSETSLWIRGVQLNLFIVPLSLLMIALKAWSSGEPMGVFDDFNIIAWFFVIFKAAQQMMELFVLKIADSMQKCFAFTLAFVIMGVLRNPFTMNSSFEYVPIKLGTGLVFAGICLYLLLDHCFVSLVEGDDEQESDDFEYRESPTGSNDSLSKGYQVINSVSIINADPYLKLLENPMGEREP